MLFQSLLTGVFTILVGVSVFVLGQIFLKSMIEPVQELRKVISEVLFSFVNDLATIHNAHVVDRNEALSAGRNLERLGASLLANQQLIPCYCIARRLWGLPKREGIVHASRRLSLISKSLFETKEEHYQQLDLYRKEVCSALGIEDPIQDSQTEQELKDEINEIRKNRAGRR